MLGIKFTPEADARIMVLFDEYRRLVDQTAPINNDLFVDKKTGETPKFIIRALLDMIEKNPDFIEIAEAPFIRIK